MNQYIEPKFEASDWTIQDAEYGDILACAEDGRPFIFKGLLDKFHPQAPVAYCGIDCEDEFMIPPGISWWTGDKVYPATKEQRDILFTKMHEAGYEWDAKKKKLKKIDPIREKVIDALRTEYEKGKHDAITEMQVTWSEEDERKLELIKALIEDAKGDSTSYSTMFREMGELNNWLESFKYRVQSLNHVIK